MLLDIKGHKALITGASSGIGEVIAYTLAGEGCDLALTARRSDELERVAAKCRKLGVMAVVLPADASMPADCEMCVREAAEQLGGLNILVYNAGVYAKDTADKFDTDALDRMLDVNLRGQMHFSRHALPHIIDGAKGSTGRGALIFISSMSGKRAYATGSGYCATKFGMLGFAWGAWEDVREHNVKVTTICPGFVNTPMVDDVPLDKDRMIQPEHVAELVKMAAKWPDSSCPNEMLINAQWLG